MVFDKSRPVFKKIAILTLFSIIGEIVYPSYLLAQSGPAQVESSGFTHASAGENVNNFTGDFTYSIPLLDIEGYPLVISYNSNVGMTQEASWVGLGWNLNPGSISRQMRGIPDEFNGEDKIVRFFNRKEQKIDGKKVGVETDVSVSLYAPLVFGGSGSFLKGSYYDNYRGYGKTLDISFGATIGIGMSFGAFGFNPSLSGNIGYSKDTQNGIGFNNALGFNLSGSAAIFTAGYGGTIASGSNTREGKKDKIYTKSSSFGTIINTKSSSNSSIIGTYATRSYTPKYNYGTLGFGFTNRKGGGIYAGVIGFGSVSLNGVKENNEFNSIFFTKIKEIPAYGYNHLERAENGFEGVMDFNREKERAFSKNMAYLPFSNITHDLYQVNTPGISGVFRGHRNDVGTLRDANVLSKSVPISLNSSKSFGVFYKESNGNGTADVTTFSGNWENLSGEDRLKFRNEIHSNQGNEKIYYKMIGEKTPFNQELYDNYNGSDKAAVKVGINAEDGWAGVLNTMSDGSSLPTVNYKTGREIRATAINYYFNNELDLISENEIKSFVENNELGDGTSEFEVIEDEYRKEHHIGKLEVTGPDGVVYGYGLPAYNLSESEVAFNVEPTIGEVDPETGLVKYDLSDNTLFNNKGRDEYYEKTQTPAYTHAHLLTEIKSSDYSDLTGNGLTPDDIGMYTKFNYTRIYGGADSFKWRFPVSSKSPITAGYPKCYYNEGFQTDNLDDKGFYNYGEKEMWLPHSIETKNFVAEFYLEDRDDAYPVVSENGQLDTEKPSKMLKKIVLYAREDRAKNGVNATPVKTIEFEYDYSLCKNNPSNKNTGLDTPNSGKLTLKSIHFYQGNSKIAYQSPYKFTYESNNPDFNYADIDRWGNYKANDDVLTNNYFPYAEQDDAIANANIKAWKLKRIVYPTGGGIEIDYEADKYAHIQDKGVMRHFALVGMSSFKDLNFYRYFAPPSNYSGGGLTLSGQFRHPDKKKRPHNVLYFKLDEPITAASRDEAEDIFRDIYFQEGTEEELDTIYFRNNVKIQQTDAKREFISGFAVIKNQVTKNDDEYKWEKSLIDTYHGGTFSPMKGTGLVGGDSGGTFYFGYIILKNDGVRDELEDEEDWGGIEGYPVHPMQKNAWNFVRLNMPWHIYAKCEDISGDPSIDDCEYNIINDRRIIYKWSIYEVLNKHHYCSEFLPALSTIKLYDPRGFKYGGNARVKSIKHFDSWDEISGEYEAEYTLEYSYDKKNDYELMGEEKITSGVATYEPINGGDENTFFKALTYNIDNLRKPDERHYQVAPIGESIFPGASVGYSEVTVKFKERENLTRNATGETKYIYNTIKDYPTKVKITPINKQSFFTSEDSKTIELLGVTQGFSVMLNDMHGKLNNVTVTDANGQQVSKTKYNYYGLDEQQKVVDENGNIEEHWLGREFDVYADKKLAVENVRSLHSNEVLEIKLGIPNYSTTNSFMFMRTGFYAVTFHKVLSQSAVLKSVETTYLGQYSKSEILAYNKYTGEPLVQKSQNGFDQDDFSVNYPAFWRYHEMSPRYRNQRLEINGLTINGSSELTGIADVKTLFSRGDQLVIDDGADQFLAYVIELYEGTGRVKLIDEDGNDIPAAGSVNILNFKSGFKNRANESIAGYYTKEDPITGHLTLTIDEDEIIAANALEYVEINSKMCEDEFVCSPQLNPGRWCVGAGNHIKDKHIGNWYPSRSYAFQGNRINNDATADTDLKNDGKIHEFKPFYAFGSGNLNSIIEAGHPAYLGGDNFQNWRKVSEISQFDRFGKPVETRSQIGTHNAVLYGYNNSFKLIPIAQASNAKVTQIGFDGFEDYYYLSDDIECQPSGHFDFKLYMPITAITDQEKHTGNYSLKVMPTQSFEVVRKISACAEEACDCEPKFKPDPGKYVLGMWAKEENSPQKLNYSGAKAIVEIIDEDGDLVGVPFEFQPSGNIVEGWQRIEGVFTIPEILTDQDYCIKIKVLNESDNWVYFDDVRVHPFVSSMQTMVYDSKLLLPMASLDAYNFATFYMYDENLNQVRIRQETDQGIHTISETAVGIKK